MNINLTALDEIYKNPKVPPQGTYLSPDEAMDLAWKIAWQGCGYVGSNPLVGAVLLDKNNTFVDAKAHMHQGKEHAEIHLLSSIKRQNLCSKIPGATLFVTLEPCSHKGLTEPCAPALAKLGLKKIYFGLYDPNPLVSGQGIQIIQSSDTKIEKFQTHTEKQNDLIFHFKNFLKYKRPFIGIKIASSLNGVVGKKNQQVWITGQRSIDYGHWLRLYYDSILVGSRTIISDNPKLTIRSFPCKKTPFRIVLDLQAKALLYRDLNKHNILLEKPENVVWVIDQKIWNNISSELKSSISKKRVSILLYNRQESQDIIEYILDFLGKKNITSLLIEGGPFTWDKFFKHRMCKKIHLFQSPQIISDPNQLLWSGSIGKKIKSTHLTLLEKDLLMDITI